MVDMVCDIVRHTYFNIEVVFLLVLLVGEGVAMVSSKAIEGYPAGYISDCPGSTKPSIITKKSLEELTFVNCGSSTWNSYNYYQMKNLAMDPTFDFNKMTVVFITGFLDSPKFPFASLISTPYLNLGYNVLSTDTNKFSTLDYPIAARLSRVVAKHIAEMLINLIQEGLDPQKIELIGISLGAHTASFIAKNYRRMTGRNITRLTALDPAGPCFRNLGPDQRIDTADADFVDIVSTNIDAFGMAAPIGHVHFYVNGGEYQLGIFLWYYCGVMCSHVYSLMIWISALRHPDSFIGIECDSVQQARNRECFDRYPQVTNTVGLNTDKSKQGIFYLATKPLYPYYLGVKGLKRKNEFIYRNLKDPNDADVYVI